MVLGANAPPKQLSLCSIKSWGGVTGAQSRRLVTCMSGYTNASATGRGGLRPALPHSPSRVLMYVLEFVDRQDMSTRLCLRELRAGMNSRAFSTIAPYPFRSTFEDEEKRLQNTPKKKKDAGSSGAIDKAPASAEIQVRGIGGRETRTTVVESLSHRCVSLKPAGNLCLSGRSPAGLYFSRSHSIQSGIQ